MSPVVRNLEELAGSRGGYGRGAGARVQPSRQQASPHSPSQSADGHGQGRDAQSFAPLAYNPAAPAAPEKIAHREKTPPPPEAVAGGTGLAAAAMSDHRAAASPPQTALSSSPMPSSGARFTHSPGSPSPFSAHAATALPAHPPQPFSSSGQRSQSLGAPSFAGPPSQSGTPTAAAPSSPPPRQGLYTPQPSQQQQQQQQSQRDSQSPAAMPLESPATQILGADYLASHAPAPPLQHLQPQYADYLAHTLGAAHTPQPAEQHDAGGYSSHSYSASTASPGFPAYAASLTPSQSVSNAASYSPAPASGASGHAAPPASQNQTQGYGGAVGRPPGQGDYDVHSQVYRPTEEEAAAKKAGRKGRKDGRAGSAGGNGDAGAAAPGGDGGRPGKLEQGAQRVEGKVNKFLSRLEKRIG